MRRALLICCLLVSTAHADPWYRGPHSTNRIAHLSVMVGLAVSFALPFETHYAPTTCQHWCEPASIDVDVRNALVWHNTGGAATVSNLAAYVVNPGVAIALIVPVTNKTTAEIMDNTIPIGESIMAALTVTRVLKLVGGRQRPYAHFDTLPPPSLDDNLSFPSGHTTAAFATAISAGMIAHTRKLSTERYVWLAGMTLAATTGYLRIAADKHYLTDVLAGATIGTGIGLTVPLLMRREVEVTATTSAVAVSGTW